LKSHFYLRILRVERFKIENETKKQEVNMNNSSEQKMRWITRIEIFFIAVVLTFLLFNMMIPSSALEIIKIGKKAGCEIIANLML